MKPPHRDLRKARIKVGWTICGRRKPKTGGILPFGLPKKNVGAFLE
jgi:hypothetical protein